MGWLSSGAGFVCYEIAQRGGGSFFWLLWRGLSGGFSRSLGAGGEMYIALSNSTPCARGRADSVIAPMHRISVLRISLESRHVMVYSTVCFLSATAAGRCFGDSTIRLRYSDSLVHC